MATDPIHVRFRLFFILTIATALIWAPAALADSTSSSNWAGYAVHRPGVSFRKVFASWTQPRASCVPGRQTWSAYWVGLGGYDPTSNALEQVGTEVDCSPSGRVNSSAWYELVPSNSVTLRMNVRPGDRIHATVTVIGRRVTIQLRDLTRHRRFRRRLRARAIDVSSAEWIVEAPSDCSATSCRTLPLTDFVSTTFKSAGARSTRGHQGPIADPAWQATKITLSPGGARFVARHGFGPSTGGASPSALTARGTAFHVTYSQMALSAQTSASANRATQRRASPYRGLGRRTTTRIQLAEFRPF